MNDVRKNMTVKDGQVNLPIIRIGERNELEVVAVAVLKPDPPSARHSMITKGILLIRV